MREPLDTERGHFERLIRLLETEAKEAAERAREKSQRLSPAQAETAGISLINLVVTDGYPDLGGLWVLKLQKKNRSLPLPWTRIGVGDPVIVTARDDDRPPVRAVVYRKRSDSLAVAVFGAPPDFGDDDGPLRVDLSNDEITTSRQKAALHEIQAAQTGRLFELRRVLLGLAAPRFVPPTDLPFPELDPTLNEAQRTAVHQALRAEDVALIHGPPGTGKTKTVVALIAAAVARGDRVLATAPSNLAVDNMLERLIAARVPTVRLGHPARVIPSLVDHTLSVQIQMHDDVKLAKKLVQEALALRRKADRNTRTHIARRQRAELRAEAKARLKDARRLQRGAAERILQGASVVCATTSVAPELLADQDFDLVVIDEAAQSTEPGSWAPILFGPRVVLAGDHRQLPPTVLSKKAAAEGFSLSLFERLMQQYGPEISTPLVMQYRMHASIMGFSSKEMYDDTLVAHPTVADHRLTDLSGIDASPLTEAPLEFIDTAGAGYEEALEPDEESRRNPDEAALVAKKVIALLEAGAAPATIGVITPYAAQARLLTERLRQPEIEVDTVDGFQGREKETIIISLVRSNVDQELGFLNDTRRMNVALTRARRKLLVIGDSATLSAHPFYARFFEYVEAVGTYRTVWEE